MLQSFNLTLKLYIYIYIYIYTFGYLGLSVISISMPLCYKFKLNYKLSKVFICLSREKFFMATALFLIMVDNIENECNDL